jgi:hypothetical protein
MDGELRTCPYRNNDDGEDTAWCGQDFQECNEDRMEKCPESINSQYKPKI